MQINKINNNTNFGTKCYIGEIGAELNLKKYNKKLTSGILDAFNKLSKNNNKDILSLSIGTPKDVPFAAINLTYFNKEGNYQSSFNILPDNLIKSSKKYISKFIQEQYEKLRSTTYKASDVIYFENNGQNIKIKKSHKNLIKELCHKYGSDDSSLFFA